MKKISLLLALCFAFFASAQTNTWDGSSSTNWNTPANWSLNQVPTAAHDVVIPNVNNKPIISATGAVCKTLTINNAGSNDNTLTLNFPGSLAVSGTVTITRASTNNISTVINVGSGSLSAGSVAMTVGNGQRYARLLIGTGTVTVSGDITMYTNNQVNFSGYGTLYIGGTMSGGTLSPSTGTVNYNNVGDQNIGGYAYYNLTTSGFGKKRLSAAITVNNNLKVNSGTFLIDNDKQISGIATGTGFLTVENGAVLQLGGESTTSKVAPTVFPTGYTKARIDLQNGSEVRYNYNG